ncbi:MAG TPA: hypothetical protein VFO62_01235, partial [Candidatus Binatia bacterium]|nr:hypothetical protein [Candidatus Binatia bacterium]
RYGRWNGAALIALVIGVLPNVPGFLAEASPRYFKDLVPGFFSTIYQYAWFVGLAISLGVYVALAQSKKTASPAAPTSR